VPEQRATGGPLGASAGGDDAILSRLRKLESITEAALANLRLDELLDVLLTRLRSVLEVDTAAVLLLDEQTSELVARAAKGIEEEVEQGVRVPLGAGFAGRVAAESRPIFLADVQPTDVVNPILIDKGIRSLLGVPLLVESRTIGVLHVGTLTLRTFRHDEAELLQAAADRIALAIDHARLYDAERQARAVAERRAEQVHDLQSITDVALSHLAMDDTLLVSMLDRVCGLLDADTAAILLLDSEGDVLVVRAAKGIEEEVERGLRIPLGGGFAGRIAGERRPVVLEDVDHAEVMNPILHDKGIRSLLGVPLLVEGEPIGVMHVGSLSPRSFTEEQVSLMELAADRIATAIDRARQHNVAEQLQRALLPSGLPEIPGLNMAASYHPAADDADVGGDWYDVLQLGSGLVGVAMGDVVSRGLRAAAFMGELRTALRAYAIEGDRPARVLTRLDRLVRGMREREMATVAYAILDSRTRELTYCLAGHPPPLVIPVEGEPRFLRAPASAPIGAVAAPRYEDCDAKLDARDTLLMYTDGLVEHRDRTLEEGMAALAEEALARGEEPEELVSRLMGRLGRSADDVAALAVRLSGVDPERVELRLPAVPGSLSPMRAALGEWLAAAGAPDDDAYDVLIAAGEAAANAVEHAYGPVDAEFEVEGRVTDGSVVLAVRDSGRWREPRGQHRGRGLLLMRELMDDVRIDRDEQGTAVEMRRALVRGEAT